jgi:hypothetical protein
LLIRKKYQKVHNDDISQVLILNKKQIATYESQLFQSELEKFRPHQTRLLQANHKQASLMKDLSTTFNNLLQDKRIKSEQSKFEAITRQRQAVMSKYRKVYQEFLDLEAGLSSAKQWYSEMKDTVASLDKNVETFVNNRRSEGAQLLNQIEQDRAGQSGGQADRERERLKQLMERMSMDPTTSPSKAALSSRSPAPGGYSVVSPDANNRYPGPNYSSQFPPASSQPSVPLPPTQSTNTQSAHATSAYAPFSTANGALAFAPPTVQRNLSQSPYDPGSYRREAQQSQPTSPPPHQQNFIPGQYGQAPPQTPQHYMPPGYVPPPPPPGPPPLGPQQTFPQPYGPPNGTQTTSQQPSGQRQSSQDPWAGLNTWK